MAQVLPHPIVTPSSARPFSHPYFHFYSAFSFPRYLSLPFSPLFYSFIGNISPPCLFVRSCFLSAPDLILASSYGSILSQCIVLIRRNILSRDKVIIPLLSLLLSCAMCLSSIGSSLRLHAVFVPSPIPSSTANYGCARRCHPD